MSENGLQKSANQRVRHQLPGLGLRNEQSSYEEWMIGNLDDSDFSIKVSARYDQIRVSSQCVGVLGIDSESTVVAFDYFISSVKGADRRMRLESYTHSMPTREQLKALMKSREAFGSYSACLASTKPSTFRANSRTMC